MQKGTNEIYKTWIKSAYVDNDMKQEMKKMSDSEIDRWFKDEPLVFGTAGYRAPMGPGPLMLNKFTYQQLAVGYAKFVLNSFQERNSEKKTKKFPKIIIGHDNRRNSKEYAIFLANVISAFNIEVLLMDSNLMIATPMVSYIIKSMKLDGGINITASHNPKEYNGFKAYNHLGIQVSNKESSKISALIPNQEINLSRKYIANPKLISYLNKNIIDKYYNGVKKSINITNYSNTFNPIVITPHHGVGCLYIEDFLKSLGHNIVMEPSQSFEDANFVNSDCVNPENHKSFENALKTAKKVNSDFVLGIDPDGDRIAAAIKHKGSWRYLSGNELGILISYYILTNKEFNNKVPIIISSYVSTSLINRIGAHYNALILRTGTGFKNIASAMELLEQDKIEYVVAFEEAIGLNTSLETREKDAIATAALLIEMYNFYKNQRIDLVDVLESRIYLKYGKWYGETVSLEIPGANWKQKAKILEKRALELKDNTKIGPFVIRDVFWNSSGECIEWKIDDDSWIKFRVSGTEPKFKIYYNLFFNDNNLYYNYEKCKEMVTKLTKIIKGKLSK